jgi:hypothetical protein
MRVYAVLRNQENRNDRHVTASEREQHMGYGIKILSLVFAAALAVMAINYGLGSAGR